MPPRSCVRAVSHDVSVRRSRWSRDVARAVRRSCGSAGGDAVRREPATVERRGRVTRLAARAVARRADGVARSWAAAAIMGDGRDRSRAGRSGRLRHAESRRAGPVRNPRRRAPTRRGDVHGSGGRVRTRARRGGLFMKRVALVLGKDLRVLRRSPILVALLIAYPLLVAVLVGLVAGYGSAKPRVALVDEDHLPAVATIGGHTFRIDAAINEVGKNVHLIRMSPAGAARALRSGRVVATLTVPRGFLATLKSGLTSPSLVYQTTRGGISPRITKQL